MTDQAFALLLHAIALVETGGRAHLVGRHGERGAFQMTPAVVASAGGYSERHAAKELRRIEAVLFHAQIDPSPFNLALAWNAGVGAVQRGRAPMASYNYALRVRNTFESLRGAVADAGEVQRIPATVAAWGNPSRPTLSLASTSASARGPEPVEARGGGTFFILFP